MHVLQDGSFIVFSSEDDFKAYDASMDVVTTFAQARILQYQKRISVDDYMDGYSRGYLQACESAKGDKQLAEFQLKDMRFRLKGKQDEA
jgi:hypothetical protein